MFSTYFKFGPALVIWLAAARRGDVPVTRFTVAHDGVTRTFDVERAFPRRILG